MCVLAPTSPTTSLTDSKTGESDLSKFIGLRSATMAVVASMIGAGIFTTTGFQAADLGHPGYIFLLWVVGGLLAFCGALCFAELGAAIPEAGAEYNYIRRSYGAMLASIYRRVHVDYVLGIPWAAR